MVELICQHAGGPHPIVGRAGVHHIAHFVDDFAASGATLTAQGIAEAMYAQTVAGMPFAFHDARAERGHFIEIYERTERLASFYDMVRAAAGSWNGADPIRRL